MSAEPINNGGTMYDTHSGAASAKSMLGNANYSDIPMQPGRIASTCERLRSSVAMVAETNQRFTSELDRLLGGGPEKSEASKVAQPCAVGSVNELDELISTLGFEIDRMMSNAQRLSAI